MLPAPPASEASASQIGQIEHPSPCHTSVVPQSYLLRTWSVPAPYLTSPLWNEAEANQAGYHTGEICILEHLIPCPDMFKNNSFIFTFTHKNYTCQISPHILGKERTEPHQRVSLSNCFKGK